MRSLVLAALLFQISETIEVHVAEVDVVVVDSAGKPVSGLTKDDFELRADGRVRPITNFYAIDRAALLRESEPTSPSASPVPRPPSPVPPTHLVIFIDQERLGLKQRNRVLASLGKFVETHLKAGVDAAVITYDHALKTRLQPTTDHAAVLAVIAEVEREAPRITEMLSERRRIIQLIDDYVELPIALDGPEHIQSRVLMYGEHQVLELQQSLAAVETLMTRLRGVPGRKVFVHVSSGLPLQPGVELYDYFERHLKIPLPLDKVGLQQMSAYQRLAASAQSAGVAFYMIDASGLTLDEGSDMGQRGDSRLDSGVMRDNLRGPLQMLADETGGKSIINENDFDRAFTEIEAQYTTYYSLGFRVDADKKMHKVDVRVKRPGLTVRTARAYRGRDADERARDGVEAAFDFPFEQNPLGVAIQVGAIEPAPHGGISVPITVTVAPGKLVALVDGLVKKGHVRCYYEMRDANGGASALRAVDEEVVVIDDNEPVALQKVTGMKMRRPGRYTLSMAVRDLTSNDTSYLIRAIEVPAPR
jgi:VWFA-related protein